jgi:hypothetical protein
MKKDTNVIFTNNENGLIKDPCNVPCGKGFVQNVSGDW